MNKIEKAEKNWKEAEAITQKVRQEYLDAYDRWQMLEKQENILFEMYLQELRDFTYIPYRSLKDGETILDTDQYKWSESHEWEYFKASVGKIWIADEWMEGTQTRTLRSTT
jgi:hypothetical protein